ncbi:MAG: pitrilysin family protein [Xenococcaceae cyanobacterium MO_188.B29]|nr:pitrilysin family protein [Xenococcaceae cyanobacterium MO_188.B29]
MQRLSPTLEQAQFPANIFRLDNGLTIIHQHLSATPVVVADIWVKAGASSEPEEWSGMAHFLEHMVFKGSPKVATGEFDWAIENSGGIANAATSHDYAHFFLTTAASQLPNTLPYLADILLHATIPEDEFIRERSVVLEEIRSSYDDPDWVGFQALCQNLYKIHPYKRSILGEEELLMQHSPNQMRCFHRTHYQPENMTVVLVGGIEQEAAISLVNESFAEFSIRSECPSHTIEAEPPLIEIARQELYLPRIEQARLTMAWLSVGVECLEDGIGLDILSVILAGSLCSRLVQELREEKQLVLDIYSDFSLQKDSSLFTISAWLETANLDLVEKIICDRLHELQDTLIPDAELNRTRRLLYNDYIFSTETPGQLAGVYGYYNTIATVEQSIMYPLIINSLSAEQIQRIARQYLSPERYAITILKPM